MVHAHPASPLLTDLYQLTMAQAYLLSGRADDEAVFHLHFRKVPFGGGYAVACGLEDALAFLAHYRFSGEDLAYLASLAGDDGQPLFQERFLRHLQDLRLTVDVDAIPEGTLVFGQEPLVRVRGPILQGQLLETTLLNLINFQTLTATKAARICLAAHPDPVIEFGLRRAQGPDGGLSASRAAFVGGCAATSNVLAGRTFGIPVRGTHAHSWVMSFPSEEEAFRAYAEAMPNNTLLLVDTYDTLQGVRRAIEIGRTLRGRGRRLAGIRLDSGDLAWLSIEARRLLDEAGFADAAIVASNDLDEHLITSLKQQGAKIGVWGVGTKLVTSYDQPALGGVYKLAAVRPSPASPWQYRVKVSEQAAKTSTPGLHQIRRFRSPDGMFVADMIFSEDHPPAARPSHIVDPIDPMRRRALEPELVEEDLLRAVVRGGQQVYDPPPLAEVQARTRAQLAALSPWSRRLVNPHEYPVGLEPGLAALRMRLVLEHRHRPEEAAPLADTAAP
jgi:nicotinate phosphoribosyltransferase